MPQTSETGSVASSVRRPPLLPPGELPPNRWARYGGVSLVAGRLVAMRRPPIFVLSMPRSGSSWVGDMLSQSDRTAYLNEPFSHAKNALGPGPVVFEFERNDVPPAYRRSMRYVRAGVPAFSPGTVRAGRDWQLRHRLGRRMVVKDVNPLAVRWLVAGLRPVVLLLVRHPAAVALSQEAQGWAFEAFVEQFLPRRRAELTATPIPSGFWALNAALQAASINTAMHDLDATRTRWRLVKYEELCRDPIGGFQELYDFSGLAWTPDVETAVREHTQDAGSATRANPYSTFRDTATMADAWRSRVDPSALADVRAGWTAHHGPGYEADSDW